MQTLRIKDNHSNPKSAFSDIPHLTRKIADKTLEQLEREGVFVFPELIKDADDLSRDQMILQSVNDTFRTGNVMGFLGCGDERLTICSRFGGNQEDYFFLYLLNKLLDFPNIVDLKTDSDPGSRLFNFLLFLFPHYLKAAMRKGLFKKYVVNRYNDENVKGSIDIGRHIRKNTPFVGKIAYNQREFSFDNYLTELTRHTIEFIKRKPYGNSLLVNVKDEVQRIVDATPGYELYDRQKIIDANKKCTVKHAYFHEYLSLQHLCLLILQNQQHQIGTGSKQVFGILFDGAWLWEEYVSTLIGDAFYHPMNKAGTGAQRLFGGNIGLIYPDFISKVSDNRVKYISIEKLIERTKGAYYDELQESSSHWHEEENDYIPFVTYQLGVILAAYREFSDRVKVVTESTRKPNRVRDIIHGHLGKITKAEIMQQCPDISQTTIQRALNDLVKSGEIIKIGGGRYTSYTWNREID